jgi:hypothetical protein
LHISHHAGHTAVFFNDHSAIIHSSFIQPIQRLNDAEH